MTTNLTIDATDAVGITIRAGTKNNVAAVVPGLTDDITKGYTVGSFWFQFVDANTYAIYICINNAEASAVWQKY